MSKLNEGEMPLARIALIGDFPICFGKDGTAVVALQWDYAAWTPMAKRFADDVQTQITPGSPAPVVAISGVVSPRLRQELEARGMIVHQGDVLADIRSRDERDSQRDVAPLKRKR